MKFNIKNETLAGLTSSFALVPEAIAFAIIVGISPMIGLTTAFILCLITSVLGGRPAMISGAAGATAIILVDLASKHGTQYIIPTVIMMGVLQILVGKFKLGKFVKLIPPAAMLGFLNGLAIIIFTAQFIHFKTNGKFISGQDLIVMLSLVAVAAIIIKFLPKLTRAVPAPLIAILFVTVLAVVFGIHTKTIGDIAVINDGFDFSVFKKIPLEFNTLVIAFPYAVIMAIVGLTETLLTLRVVDDMTNSTGNPNRECVAQGIANVVCGAVGGMGGCAMIGQSIVNVEAKGRTRLSSFIAAISLLVFLSVGSHFISKVPMAALVGLMLMVSVNMFQWNSLKVLSKDKRLDFVIMQVVTAITVVYHNLALAITIGTCISALAYVWKTQHALEK